MLMGLAWGAVFPVTKVALTAGYQPFGIMFWQSAIAVVLSGIGILLRRKPFMLSREAFGLYLGIAMFGAVLPNYFSFTANAALPAGVLSIIIALVPLFSMPMALLLGFEKLSLIRTLGAACGAVAVLLLIGPSTSLPDPAMATFVLLGLLAPLFYGMEGNFLIWYGARGLDPLQILFGATLISLVVALVLALTLGQYASPLRVWSWPEWAIVVSSILNWAAYIGYVWLIGRAGPVFASQVAYMVTGWGVIWSMVLLGERYSLWVWGAFGLMLLGIALVRPRNNE